jgi:hydroxylamine reductase (hybrid-cluster protein)
VYEQRQAEWENSLVAAQKVNNEKMEDQRKAALVLQQKLLMQVRLNRCEMTRLLTFIVSFQSEAAWQAADLHLADRPGKG